MEEVTPMVEFDVRVVKVKTHKEDTLFTVFEAVVLNWRPRKKEWVETKQRVVCVGYFYNLIKNDHLHLIAEEVDDAFYGNQYRVQQATRVAPGTELELKKFLTSIAGVGIKTATLLIEQFGLDVLSKIADTPSLLNELPIPQPAKDKVYQVIAENQAFEQLLMFLQTHKVSPSHAGQIYSKYGANAIAKMRDNPYALYLDDVLSFRAADQLNQALGNPPDSPFRISAGIFACLQEDTENNGNLFVPSSSIQAMLSEFLAKSLPEQTDVALNADDISQCINDLARSGYLWVDYSLADDDPMIYLKSNYYAEARTAARLHEIATAPKQFYALPRQIEEAYNKVVQRSGLTLAEEQKIAIFTALVAPISILTGGPGTGKTQTLTMLIQTIKDIYPNVDIRLCAPTGKAAVRMKELTNMPAATIHRTVNFPKRLLDTNELTCDLLIVDEFSMCDIQVCSWLMNCISTSARVLIVGDHEQLPSVGPGLVLRDMIDSNIIPVTRLTKVFRQANQSRILSNAHAIINTPDGAAPQLTYATEKGGDFYLLEAHTQKAMNTLIQRSVLRLLEEGFPLEQIEILTPIHGGKVGSDELNLTLQALLNKEQVGYQTENGQEFRVGDKVIQTKNNYDLSVFNGETGTVKTLNFSPDKALEVSYPNKDVWYSAEEAEELDLAYAITTHRSQGSEFAAVIIPIHESLLFNYNKQVLYTAITRAKKRVILVGSPAALEEALKKNNVIERKSNLVQRLRSTRALQACAG